MAIIEKIIVEQRLADEAPGLVPVYASWAAGGMVGMHRFRLGMWKSACAMAVLTIGGAALALHSGNPLFLAPAAWPLSDALFLARWTSAAQDRARSRIETEIGFRSAGA